MCLTHRCVRMRVPVPDTYTRVFACASHVRVCTCMCLTQADRVAGAHPTDVRMTTRFKEHDLTEGLTGAIHETGHSLYEQVSVSLLKMCQLS